MIRYTYIFRVAGQVYNTEPVPISKLLRTAYQFVDKNPDLFADPKPVKAQIKAAVNAIDQQVKNTQKQNRLLAKEKADRIKSIELHRLLEEKKATGNQIDDPYDDTSLDLEAVLATPRAPNKPRSKDYAYMKAWRAKRAAEKAAGIAIDNRRKK